MWTFTQKLRNSIFYQWTCSHICLCEYIYTFCVEEAFTTVIYSKTWYTGTQEQQWSQKHFSSHAWNTNTHTVTDDDFICIFNKVLVLPTSWYMVPLFLFVLISFTVVQVVCFLLCLLFSGAHRLMHSLTVLPDIFIPDHHVFIAALISFLMSSILTPPPHTHTCTHAHTQSLITILYTYTLITYHAQQTHTSTSIAITAVISLSLFTTPQTLQQSIQCALFQITFVRGAIWPYQ